MSVSQKKPEIPFFIPKPRSLNVLDGTTELSSDVRLATSNVIPYMRKTMRSIFTAAGIRVVANKKRFIIQVNIVEPEKANWDDVPETFRKDYYKMDVVDNVVTISSPSQVGAIWGVQSFADLFQAAGVDAVIPNCIIRDWATIPVRGAAIPASPMCRRMRLDEYGAVVDRLARSRMNTLIIGLYGPPPPFAPELGETLLVPFDTYPELIGETAVVWEPAQPAPMPEGMFEAKPPTMIVEDFFADLVVYGCERGVNVVPSLDVCEMTDLLAKICPQAGELDNPLFREVVAELYGSLLKRYCPDGLPYFHVSLTAIADRDAGDYAAWLVELLTVNGVGTVVLDAEGATESVVDKLLAAGLAEKVCLLGSGAGVGGFAVWNTLAIGTSDWRGFAQEYDPELPANDPLGVVCKTSVDATWVFDEYLVAVKAWNPEGTEDVAVCRERAIGNIAGRFAKRFLKALPELRHACAALPETLVRLPVNQLNGGEAFVSAVIAELGDDGARVLDEVIVHAKAAYETLLPSVTTEGESTPFPTITKTFIGEAARMIAVAQVCKSAILGTPVGETEVDAFTEMMQGVSSYKPRHSIPYLMSGMTMLRNYLKQRAAN